MAYDSCHNLKHKSGTANRLLNEMKVFVNNNRLAEDEKENINSAITYFSNNKSKIEPETSYKENRNGDMK